MALPITHDVTFYAGDDDEFILIYEDPLDTPVDISGSTARMQIRRRVSSDTVELELTAIIDGPAGKLTFAILGTDMAALNPENAKTEAYVYDVELTTPGPNVTTLAKGCFHVEPEVTRD